MSELIQCPQHGEQKTFIGRCRECWKTEPPPVEPPRYNPDDEPPLEEPMEPWKPYKD